MSSLVLMEYCGKRFRNFSTEELKQAFYQLMLKNPMAYAQISEYLTEFSNRGYRDFVIDYLLEYPLCLERKSARLVMEVLKDMPNRILSKYGHFAHTMYDLYHRGKLDNNKLSFEEYLLEHPAFVNCSSENRVLLRKIVVNF